MATSKRLKVLQISKFYPPYKGGIELVAEMISRAHEDDKVEIISFGKENKKYIGHFGETVNEFKTDLFLMSTPFNYSLLYHPKNILNYSHFDLVYVHIHNPFVHFLLFLYGWVFKESKVEIVCVYHSDIFKGIVGKIFDLFFVATSSIYDRFLVSSQKLKASSNILKYIESSKIYANPFPVKGQESYIHRDKFNYKLLAIGRFVPYKGFSFLVDVINDFPEYELNIIGNGPLFEEIKANARSHIKLHGSVSDEQKERLLLEADVLIVPSITAAEAYGMISVEAFQKGIPVIASNINTGVTFLVQNNITGLTFEPLDREGLVKCLKVISDDNNFIKLKKNAFSFYNETLKFEKFQERLLEKRRS